MKWLKRLFQNNAAYIPDVWQHHNLIAKTHREQPNPCEGWSPWLSNKGNITGECPIPWAKKDACNVVLREIGLAIPRDGTGWCWRSNAPYPITRYRYLLKAMPVTSGATYRHYNLVATVHHEQPDPRKGWSPWLSNEDNVTGECPIPWARKREHEICKTDYTDDRADAVFWRWHIEDIDPITRYRYRLTDMR